MFSGIVEALGTVWIGESDTYTFGVDRDDLFRLYIDGVLLSQGGCCGETYAQIALDSGFHSIRLLFGENGGGADVELYAARGAFTAWNPDAFRLVGDELNGGLEMPEDVPEPATMALMGLAVAGLGGYVRRRRKA